jgi:hypothetical protein
LNESSSNYDETDNMMNGEIIVRDKQTTVKSGGLKKRKVGSSREDRILKIKLIVGVNFISLFFFLLYYMFNNYLSTANDYVAIYDNLSREHSNNLYVFNYLREYFFDRSSSYLGKNVNKTILAFIDNIYSEKLKNDIVKFIKNRKCLQRLTYSLQIMPSNIKTL